MKRAEVGVLVRSLDQGRAQRSVSHREREFFDPRKSLPPFHRRTCVGGHTERPNCSDAVVGEKVLRKTMLVLLVISTTLGQLRVSKKFARQRRADRGEVRFVRSSRLFLAEPLNEKT